MKHHFIFSKHTMSGNQLISFKAYSDIVDKGILIVDICRYFVVNVLIYTLCPEKK